MNKNQSLKKRLGEFSNFLHLKGCRLRSLKSWMIHLDAPTTKSQSLAILMKIILTKNKVRKNRSGYLKDRTSIKKHTICFAKLSKLMELYCIFVGTGNNTVLTQQ